MKWFVAVGITIVVVPPLLLVLGLYEAWKYWRDHENYMWE
jgi:hypothetical protein